jgi:hypothetical protein
MMTITRRKFVKGLLSITASIAATGMSMVASHRPGHGGGGGGTAPAWGTVTWSSRPWGQ